MRRIPLRRRDGTVCAHALVDDEDYAELAQHRWHLTHYGYAARDIGGRANRRKVYMHRAIAGERVDHKDQNKLNNCRSNLRPASHAENMQNLALRADNKSGVRGVCWLSSRRKWLVQCKGRHIGHFDSLEEAERAVREARAATMPFSQDAA